VEALALATLLLQAGALAALVTWTVQSHRLHQAQVAASPPVERVAHAAEPEAPWRFARPLPPVDAALARVDTPDRSVLRPGSGRHSLGWPMLLVGGLLVLGPAGGALIDAVTRLGEEPIEGPTLDRSLALVALLLPLGALAWGVAKVSEVVVALEATPAGLRVLTRRARYFARSYRVGGRALDRVEGGPQSAWSRDRYQERPRFHLRLGRRRFVLDVARAEGQWLVDELRAWRARMREAGLGPPDERATPRRAALLAAVALLLGAGAWGWWQVDRRGWSRDALLEAIAEDGRFGRATLEFERRGATAVPGLREALAGPRAEEAVRALEAIGGAAARPALIEATGHDHAQVRLLAVRALRLDDAPAVDAALRRVARTDPDPRVGEAARELLAGR